MKLSELNNYNLLNNFCIFLFYFGNILFYEMGIGDWDWGLGIGPNPQSPIPHPPSPIPILFEIYLYTNKNILKIFYNV